MKLSERVSISILHVSKGHNSVQNVGGVTVLVLCTSSDCAIIFVKFRESISKGRRVIE